MEREDFSKIEFLIAENGRPKTIFVDRPLDFVGKHYDDPDIQQIWRSKELLGVVLHRSDLIQILYGVPESVKDEFEKSENKVEYYREHIFGKYPATLEDIENLD